jgi:hypothetical protein
MDFLAVCMQSARRKHVDGRCLLPRTSVADAAVHHSSIIRPPTRVNLEICDTLNTSDAIIS